MNDEGHHIDEDMLKHFEERFDYDPWEEEFICRNSGLLRTECQCMECIPECFRFKFLCIDCKTIDDGISTLKDTLAYFQQLREQGYYIDGPIEDDYMEIYPPKREGYYWARCQTCGSPFMVQKGVVYPMTCDNCDLQGEGCGDVRK